MIRLDLLVMLALVLGVATARGGPDPPERIDLPEPSKKGRISLEEAIAARRSVREYAKEPLTLPQISQLLWAAQAVTSREGDRAAPSAGALFPLETYVVLPEAIYRYASARHRLVRHLAGDLRAAIHAAALSQDCVRDAPAVFVFAAVPARTAGKYGRERAPLEAVALGLCGLPVGAFDDARLARALSLPPGRGTALPRPGRHAAALTVV